MKFLDIADDAVVELAATGDMPEAVHQFEPRQIRAVNAALAARRPLLVRGEPGIGKSQLARAAAKGLGRAFVPHTVDARTESRDLLWHFDAVARLAEAQLLGALDRVANLDTLDPAPSTAERGGKPEGPNIRDRLAIARFLHPRALWWAFDWNGALDRAKAIGISAPPQPDGGDPANGCLVLIDEIDKAEMDVPNGLLEALGVGSFHPQGCTEPVKATGIAPLVVITTNEERALPDAFVRRCLVLHLRLPSDPRKLAERLIARGHAHFDRHKPPASDKVLQHAAELLVADRETSRENHWLPLPGQAEYLDLVRAVITRERTAKAQEALMEKVAEFILKKHPDAFQRIPEQDAD
ncbi:AAA family ATPase [Candidatus Competibacter phosphatis]|uniref:AAA family ATPase n=1 Tax=Candidatus Competibacter phosphatis TaxID=221280 RepID=A0ABX1TJM6_9GAMM|nr:AAA family ATPase [Candidatus Competibacter phosphatis]NMQ19586.1 AAA family ATPase [Candidatus Competibacter phosphatis]